MSKFLELEGGYLVIALFVIAVTLFVSTRPFVGGGKSWKKAVPIVSLIMFGFVYAHFYVTTDRMEGVKERFNSGGLVICESRAMRKVAQSIVINPNQEGWKLEGDVFTSPMYNRVFHSARCLKYDVELK